MDAAYGSQTNNLWLFGGTGDFGDIGGKSKGIVNQYVTQIYKLIDAKKRYPRQSLIRKE